MILEIYGLYIDLLIFLIIVIIDLQVGLCFINGSKYRIQGHAGYIAFHCTFG